MPHDFDASQFLRGLRLADAAVRRGAVRGVAKGLAHGERLGRQYCPVRTGTLAGTIVGDVAGIIATDTRIVGLLTAGGGEASDYALVQHEAVLHHADGTYAAKFIERPIKELKGKLGPVIAAEIRAEAG